MTDGIVRFSRLRSVRLQQQKRHKINHFLHFPLIPLADPKIMGPKIIDPKIMDPKIMDPKIMDPKIMDPKIADQGRMD